MQNVPLLLGAVSSQYSARARSYLIKKRIQYVERVPSIWTYKVSIGRRFGDAAVPVLVTPEGDWIADSTIILDRMEVRHPEEPILPSDPVHALLALLGDAWGGEFWLPVDMWTRWSRPEHYPWWREELGEGLFAGFPKVAKNALIDKVSRHFDGHLQRLGATAATGPLFMRWASGMADALDAHLAHQPYLLGERATRFDFGVIVPWFGHIVQDAVSRNELLMPRPHLHAWVWRMQQPYLSAEVPPLPAIGTPVPSALNPIVRSIFDEMLPYVEATLAEVRYAAPKPARGKRIPRLLPEVTYPYAGSTHRRPALPYIHWMVQRALDLLAAMPRADAERTRAWVRDSGGARLLELDIPRLDVSGLTVKLA
jgi:glutathione S-transferase